MTVFYLFLIKNAKVTIITFAFPDFYSAVSEFESHAISAVSYPSNTAH